MNNRKYLAIGLVILMVLGLDVAAAVEDDPTAPEINEIGVSYDKDSRHNFKEVEVKDMESGISQIEVDWESNVWKVSWGPPDGKCRDHNTIDTVTGLKTTVIECGPVYPTIRKIKVYYDKPLENVKFTLRAWNADRFPDSSQQSFDNAGKPVPKKESGFNITGDVVRGSSLDIINITVLMALLIVISILTLRRKNKNI